MVDTGYCGLEIYLYMKIRDMMLTLERAMKGLHREYARQQTNSTFDAMRGPYVPLLDAEITRRLWNTWAPSRRSVQ